MKNTTMSNFVSERRTKLIRSPYMVVVQSLDAVEQERFDMLLGTSTYRIAWTYSTYSTYSAYGCIYIKYSEALWRILW